MNASHTSQPVRGSVLFSHSRKTLSWPSCVFFFLFSSCVLELSYKSLERELIVPSQLILNLVEAEDRIMYFERIGSSGF